MNAEQSGGQEPEKQTPPTVADGTSTEIDRSVLGTDLRSGFAEIRARAKVLEDRLSQSVVRHKARGSKTIARMDECGLAVLDIVLSWLDDIEAHAKDASTGS